LGGDPTRIGEIRAGKIIRPRMFDAATALLYAWTFEPGADAVRHARTICEIAGNLYQLGRGVDMAWAQGEVVDESEADTRLREHAGILWRPGETGEGAALSCPRPGSLESLTRRFEAMRGRFKTVKKGDKDTQLFAQAPKPDLTQVRYNSPSTFLIFDIRRADAFIRQADGFAAQPLERVVPLTEKVRDLAAQQLKMSGWRRDDPKREAFIEKIFIGRDSREADKPRRLRITPLPSIGHAQAERSIRRVLVAVPPDCPIATGDIGWAFSGLALDLDPQTGEVPDEGAGLVPAGDRTMLGHYGIESEETFRLWRTVTPAALPERAARRRIDPRRMREEATGGTERLRENEAAENAVRQALRQASFYTPVESIRVQREPFEAKGCRAEAFAPETRFPKERLWHVEIAFSGPLCGPLLIGDGRYLGLGLMAPVRNAWRDAMVFAVSAEGNIAASEGLALVDAARRALMALARETLGKVPRLFSGHENDGSRAASGRHEHIFLATDDADHDGRVDRLLVMAPWFCDRSIDPDWSVRQSFDRVVSRLQIIRAGRLGVIRLGPPTCFNPRDRLIGPARTWQTQSRYRATRHAGRRKDPTAALVRDMTAECARRNLPRPEVDVADFCALPNGGGLLAHVRLRFAIAIPGPLLLGRDSHRGGGLFVAVA
jgi:CRISPR-associated protein Csb2